MIFNSLEFAIFLPLVFLLYWGVGVKRIKTQNAILLIASYVFYGWWDWRFLSLIAFSTVVDFFVGINLQKTESNHRRKILLMVSIVVNLGFLGVFKYYNFFIESFIEAFSLFGYQLEASTLNIILPVGISFYTFQTLSYSIDVYRRHLVASSDPVAFFTYVSFFPQLVAGPIERATNLLPQFSSERKFEYKQAVDGMRQILWGLFKKMVIADNCALYVNSVYNGYEDHSGLSLFLASVLFAFQIYGDFSGYSDIAIGTSRLFGFSLMRNFAYPYFSRDIAEFWRRWHISLSTWFRDYLYIPLGGSRVKRVFQLRNTFIIFGVSGLWHGANWTFLVWGVLHALYFIPLMVQGKNRRFIDPVGDRTLLPSLNEFFRIVTTFTMVSFAWIFFRAESLGQAVEIISKMCSADFFTGVWRPVNYITTATVLFMVLVEWIQRQKQHGLELSEHVSLPIRWLMYCGMVMIIVLCAGQQHEFIYFQF